MWYPLVNVYSLRTGKSPFFMGKSTNGNFQQQTVCLPEGEPKNEPPSLEGLPISGESLGMLHGAESMQVTEKVVTSDTEEEIGIDSVQRPTI